MSDGHGDASAADPDLQGQLRPVEQQSDPNHMEGRVLYLSDQSKVEYVDVGSGPTVVFLHGLASSWHIWRSTIIDLQDEFRCVAMDIPGFGNSATRRRNITADGLARLVHEAIHMIIPGPFVLCAHSMGALVALKVAENEPAELRRLVLCNGTLASVLSIISNPLTSCRHPVLALRLGFLLAVGSIGVPNSVLGAVVSNKSLRKLTVGQFLRAHAHLTTEDLLEALQGLGTMTAFRLVRAERRWSICDAARRVKTQVALLVSEADPLIPTHDVEVVSSQFEFYDVVTISRVGHAPMLEHSKKFSALLRTTLRNGSHYL